MNRVPTGWPDVDHPRTPVGWSWPANLMAAQGPAAWPRGRRASSEAEDMLSEAVAWWDVERSGFRDGDRWLRNLGSAGGVLDLRLGSSLVANSNDPKWLGPEASGYTYVPAVAVNFLSVPHVASTQVGDSLDARVDVAADTWDPGSALFFMGKAAGTTAGNLGFAWSTNSSSRLLFQWSDASVATTAQLVALNAAPFTTATRLRLRVTYERDTGAGQYAVKFWYNDSDFVTALDALSSWTQIGSTLTGASTGAMSDPTADVLVAARRSASDVPLAGRYYGASLAVGGSTVFLVDCDALTTGSAASFTATTGQQVTINRATSGRKSVAMPSRHKGGRACMLHGSDDYMELNVGQRRIVNALQGENLSIFIVGRQWATPPSGGAWIASRNATSPTGWAIRNATTTLQVQGVIGDTASLTVGGITPTGTFTSGTNAVCFLTINWASGVGTMTSAATNTVGTASLRGLQSLTPGNGLRIGSNPDGFGFTDLEFRAAAVWRRPLTTREITVLANSGIWGT